MSKKGTPAALSEMILPASEVHNYNTRYATDQNLYTDQLPELIMVLQD